ncbi:MAG: choice-of-anchor J domain-containing protein, partial [Bacteroidetes bacterium]|nr:choice-of-anchor J domain-containing protein [Bacteroidota bacterium]
MKKFTIQFLFILFLAPQFLSAQVYLSEDFNGGWPAGWTTINNDGLTPNTNVAVFTDAWIILEDFDSTGVADSVAASTSWYTPAGQSDDYMITPSINIGASSGVFWDAQAVDPNFPDGYELRISTTTPDVAGFMANPALYTITAAPPTWTNFSVNLASAGYANQAIYLAWRNNSNDQFILAIDNIVVKELASADATVAKADSLSQYSRIPYHQNPSINLSGRIANVGGAPVTGAKLIAEVFRNGVSVHKDSSAGTTLASSASASVSLAPYIPTDTGTYSVSYSVSINEADGNAANNTLAPTFPLIVNDSVFARDAGPVINGLGIGAGTTGELGLNYTITKTSVLNSVSIFMANINDVMVGQPISVKVYFFSNTPNTEVAATQTVTVTQTGPHWLTIPIMNGPFTLPPGTFTFAIQEGDSSVSMGYTAGIFTENAAWVTFDATPPVPWTPSEDVGFAVSYMIRPNLTCDLRASVTSVTDNTCPGDMAGAIDLSVTGGTMPYTFAWSNGATTEDVSGLAVGTYTATVTDAAGCVAKSSDIVVSSTDSLPDGEIMSNITGGQVGFSANSTTGTSYSWTFGDGGTSTLENPVHTYSANGTYTVTLIVTNDCGNSTFSQVVDMQTVGLEDDMQRNITIAPNPNQGVFNIHFTDLKLEDASVEIFSMSGQKVYAEKLDPIVSSYEHSINLGGKLATGVYILEISNEN